MVHESPLDDLEREREREREREEVTSNKSR